MRYAHPSSIWCCWQNNSEQSLRSNVGSHVHGKVIFLCSLQPCWQGGNQVGLSLLLSFQPSCVTLRTNNSLFVPPLEPEFGAALSKSPDRWSWSPVIFSAYPQFLWRWRCQGLPPQELAKLPLKNLPTLVCASSKLLSQRSIRTMQEFAHFM